jgi:hypothetical protein
MRFTIYLYTIDRVLLVRVRAYVKTEDDGSLMNKDISDSLYLYLKHHNNNYREIFQSGCFLFVKNLK